MASTIVSLDRSFAIDPGSVLGIPGNFSKFIGLDKPLSGRIDLIPPLRSKLLDLSLSAGLGPNDRLRAGVQIDAGVTLGNISGSTTGSLTITSGTETGGGNYGLTVPLSFQYTPVKASLSTSGGRAYLKVDPDLSLTLNPGISYDVDPIGKKWRWRGTKSLNLSIPDQISPIIDIDSSRGDGPKTGGIAGLEYSATLPKIPSFSLSNANASVDPVTGKLTQTIQDGTRIFSSGFDIASLSPIPLSLKGEISVGPFSAFADIIGVKGLIGLGLEGRAKTQTSMGIELEVKGEDGSRHLVKTGNGGLWTGGSDNMGLQISDFDGDGYFEGNVIGRVTVDLSAEISAVPVLTGELKAFGASAGLTFNGIKVGKKRIGRKKLSLTVNPLISIGAAKDLGSFSLIPASSGSFKQELFNAPFVLPSSAAVGVGINF